MNLSTRNIPTLQRFSRRNTLEGFSREGWRAARVCSRMKQRHFKLGTKNAQPSSDTLGNGDHRRCPHAARSCMPGAPTLPPRSVHMGDSLRCSGLHGQRPRPRRGPAARALSVGAVVLGGMRRTQARAKGAGQAQTPRYSRQPAAAQDTTRTTLWRCQGGSGRRRREDRASPLDPQRPRAQHYRERPTRGNRSG